MSTSLEKKFQFELGKLGFTLSKPLEELNGFSTADAIKSGICKVPKEDILKLLHINGYSAGQIYRIPYSMVEIWYKNNKEK